MATKDKAADAAQTDRPDEGFKDISAEVEQARQDAQAPVELDSDGQPKPRTSEAANVVNQEQAYRAGAQSNGGGPWPPELLAKIGTTVGRSTRQIPAYTSHLSEKEQQEARA